MLGLCLSIAGFIILVILSMDRLVVCLRDNDQRLKTLC